MSDTPTFGHWEKDRLETTAREFYNILNVLIAFRGVTVGSDAREEDAMALQRWLDRARAAIAKAEGRV